MNEPVTGPPYSFKETFLETFLGIILGLLVLSLLLGSLFGVIGLGFFIGSIHAWWAIPLGIIEGVVGLAAIFGLCRAVANA